MAGQFLFDDLERRDGVLVGRNIDQVGQRPRPLAVPQELDAEAHALGGALGTMAVAAKHEIVLGIIGGLFVAEMLSVMIQVGYFKWSGGKRIFLMAPIHHHFEKLGWKESTVVIRFWIISFVLALAGLATLKLR